ncbi:hypothetical protein NX02_24145 [Sphingomonas sanxanigenens DSM 19645 = NX02]|uniref:Uncharacterized protein n=2 Tax=Sphingomonas sanxanigenens TaxID=397260 RepID=W0AIP0_9SPHN|nr:hypothetical protein NX02_24145 [Sphingomonas sanxanigenens DSM 19645 = NX02]
MSYIPKEPVRGLENPLFALWALPFEMHQAMMTMWWDAWRGAAPTTERSSGPTDAHLPVPSALQGDDKEIFA